MTPPLTQDLLARRLGISRASLANIETGRQSILVHQLYGFAEALDLSPSDFLLPAEKVTASAWEAEMPSDLKPKQKEQLARLIAEARPDMTTTREGTNVKQSKR